MNECWRKVLRCKIHRATVTHADLAYEGSISLPPELMAAAGIAPYEAVNVWDVTNGARLETYAIRGDRDSRTISINGAAAHLVSPGDIVIIAAFQHIPDHAVAGYEPTVIFVDDSNRIVAQDREVPGPRRRAEMIV